MKQKMAAIIRKDLRNITANKNLFLSLLIVPLVFTIIFPSILVCAIHFMPDDPDIQKMLELLPMSPSLRKYGAGPDGNDSELYSSCVFSDHTCNGGVHYVSQRICRRKGKTYSGDSALLSFICETDLLCKGNGILFSEYADIFYFFSGNASGT